MNAGAIIQSNKNVYNKIAKHFSDTRSYVWEDIRPLAKYVKGGDRILDLACGNGRLYLLFKENANVEYIGVDFSEELLRQAAEKFPGVSFRYGEMTDIPLKNSEFDIVYCLAAFHHLPDNQSRLRALSEIKRVLKPGGRLVMTNWNIYSDWAREKLRAGKWKYGRNYKEIIVPWKNSVGRVIGERIYYAFKKRELAVLFEQAGFQTEDQYFSIKKGGKGMNIVSVARVK